MNRKKIVETISPFKDFSEKYVPLIDRFIKDFFDKKIKHSSLPFMKEMYAMLREYCTRDGKRVRPIVLANAYSGYRKGRDDFSEVIKLAAVIEIMHSFLLIQDDIIDKSALRRGGKAMHLLTGEKYGPRSHNSNIGSDLALIMADVLFANSIEIISNAGIRPVIKNEFLKVFSSTYEMTAWGQILDILHSLPRNFGFRKNVAMDISSLKTAHYTIYYPMLMGYILAGGSDKKESGRIGEFALPLGLAFQVRDDILGVFGRERDTGKPEDSDIIEGKITLLVHFTVNSIKGAEREKFLSLFTMVKKRKREIAFIRGMIDKSGALEKSMELHGRLVETSAARLTSLKMRSVNRDILTGIIDAIRKVDI